MYAQGADEAILVLAPVLLLLNQDPLLFRGLTDARRYFPPVFAAAAYLAGAAALTALGKYRAMTERPPFGTAVTADSASFGFWFLAKNVALLLLTLPNHVIFLQVCPCSTLAFHLLADTLHRWLSLLEVALHTRCIRLCLRARLSCCYSQRGDWQLQMHLTSEINRKGTEWKQYGLGLKQHADLQYLWTRAKASTFTLVAFAPVAAFAAIATDLASIRLLAGMAIAMAGVQFGLMRTLRREGMKLI